MLEYRVHTEANPDDLLLYTIENPDNLGFERVDWMPDIRTSRTFGDKWAASERSVVLVVPSVVVPRQFNYLLNPTNSNPHTRQAANIGSHVSTGPHGLAANKSLKPKSAFISLLK